MRKSGNIRLVVPYSLQELESALEHLSSNKPETCDDEQSIVFPRGVRMSGGRLDLCKEVEGLKGVHPLLNDMKFIDYCLVRNLS